MIEVSVIQIPNTGQVMAVIQAHEVHRRDAAERMGAAVMEPILLPAAGLKLVTLS